jgi:hypothetical protein
MPDAPTIFKHTGEELRVEVRERTISYIIAAFGFVAGLAWNEAVKALIEFLFPLSTNTLLAKFLYAIVVTIVVVLISVSLVRVGRSGQQK